jgi:phosphatidylglycerol:prolipoprotein diacylglycerol transferase
MHPILFSIGDFDVHFYGALIALGTITAVLIARKWGIKDGFGPDLFTDLGFWCIVGGVVGGRLEYVRTNWPQFDGNLLTILNLRQGGLVFYGGLFGVFVAFVAIVILRKKPVLKVLDIMAPLIPLGHVFGRTGCLFAGCCHGKEAHDLPWAITFTDPGAAMDSAFLNTPLHPTQVYAMLYLGALAGFLVFMRNRKAFHGQLILLYLSIYPVLRSINEMFRADESRGWVIDDVMTNAQAISLVIALVATVAWVTLLVKKRKEKAAAPAPEPAGSDG